MKPATLRPLVSALLFVFALGLLLALPVAAQKNYRELVYPPLRDLQLPDVQRTVLPNGMVLYLVEDHTVPKVEGTAIIRAGDRLEPADKIGLGSILGQAMRTGGTEDHPGEEIDRQLENVGASVETGVGTDSATASLFALKEDLPLVLEILADLLQHPAFPEDKIDLAKVQERTAIARRNDDVGDIAAREFSKLIYGAESPYARQTEYATINAVTRADLVAFHDRYFVPNQTILGLWGDFNAVEAKALVEKYFAGWPRSEAAAPPTPEVPRAWQGSITLIQKDDINQTNFRIGHLADRYDDPDYYALNVMAEILGGGFSSRLVRHIRSDMGLAYAAGAAWRAAYDHPGYFIVRVDTKSETTAKALRAILNELQTMTREPVTEEELRVAKEGILNSFVFNFNTTGEIVERLMTYEYYDYPRDFLEKFKANIEKVTADDVLRAAQKHLHPDQLIVLAVGRSQDFDEPLSAFGKVNTIDISIAEPKAEAAAVPEATEESLARGHQVLEAAVAGLGGRDTLEGLHDVSILGDLTQVTPQGELTLNTKTVIALPGSIRADVVTPFGPFTMVATEAGGWMKSPQGVADLPGAQLEDLRTNIARYPPILLLGALKEDRPAQYIETATVGDSQADVILVTDATGGQVKLWIEKGTGHILKRSFQASVPGKGPVTQEQVFSDFRQVSGLTVPFKETTFHNGQKAGERTVKSFEVNVGINEGTFAREEAKPQPQQ